jgi:hypothetical protein
VIATGAARAPGGRPDAGLVAAAPGYGEAVSNTSSRPGSARGKRLGLGVLLALLCVVSMVFGVHQVHGLSLSRTIQHGPQVTARTQSVAEVGAHGGAYLNVEFVTAAGQLVRAEVHDGESDGVTHRESLPVRYDAADPEQAEVAGQPLNTPGQAVLDFVLAGCLAVGATLFFLGAFGRYPLGFVSRRGRQARPT